jgi:hypothetical protein
VLRTHPTTCLRLESWKCDGYHHGGVNVGIAQLACPRDGHLEAVYRIFACLSNKHNSRIVFDPTHAEIDMISFKQECNWREFCGDAKEPMPPKMPKPRGEEAEICLHLDSDHAGDQLIRPFLCVSKFSTTDLVFEARPSLETSAFVAEFVAVENGMEIARGLQCKLCVMGVPIDGSACVCGDNLSAIHNAQCPESMSKK